MENWCKSITSNNNNALVFRPLTYDDLGFPEYNYISYHWDLDSVSKSEAYLTYGSRIQISYANESNDSFEEIGTYISLNRYDMTPYMKLYSHT